MQKYTYSELKELQKKIKEIDVPVEIKEYVDVLSNSRMFLPIEQRSFLEFVRDFLIEQLKHTKIDLIVDSDDIYDLFDIFVADGTMTYSSEKASSYIYAFQDEFDMEDEEYSDIVNCPEHLLLRQTMKASLMLYEEVTTLNNITEITPADLIAILSDYKDFIL